MRDLTSADAQEMDSLPGSFILQASLSEGFFLLHDTTLSARVLFIKCFYFSVRYLANSLVGGFLPLCSACSCSHTALVFLSTVLLQHQLCLAGLQFCSPGGVSYLMPPS